MAKKLSKLNFGAYQAANNCMKIKQDEKVVIITDKKTIGVGRAIKNQVTKLTKNISFFVMEDFGKRPLAMPEKILAELKIATASFYCASKYPGELAIFRRPIHKLVEGRVLRHANMVGINRQLMEQGMNADYAKLKEFTNKVYLILRDSKIIQVKSKRGTDITARVGKYKWYVSDGDITEGHWSNLPDGEVFTTPEDVNGTVVIDGVLGDTFDEKYGCLKKNPMSIQIKDCFAIPGSIKCKNKNLEKEFNDYVFRKISPLSARVGEFALGTNLQLKKIVGRLLQDEKFPGVHIAFGDSLGDKTGSKFSCPTHIDGVILKPTVIVDSKIIMDNGKYLI